MTAEAVRLMPSHVVKIRALLAAKPATLALDLGVLAMAALVLTLHRLFCGSATPCRRVFRASLRALRRLRRPLRRRLMNPKIGEAGAKERRDIGAEPGIKTRGTRITLCFRLVGGEHRRSEKNEKASYGNPVLVHVLLGNE